MTDPQPWWETVNWLDVVLTSGLFTTLLSIFLKWRLDKKKIPLERKQIESSIATDNVSSTVAINAEYRQLLEVHKQSFKEDLERQTRRHEEELAAIRRNHDHALDMLRSRLDGLEESNNRLTDQVRRLQQDDRNSQAELTRQHRRIGNLENKLTSAKDTVVNLLEYIKAHNPGTGEIPVVDFTIFDH